MPRAYPPRRVRIDARLDAADLADVDALAEAEERTRSEMLRILLRLGVAARKGAHLEDKRTTRDAGRPRKDTG